MNTKTTLLVALLAILLGAYVLVFETDMFSRRRPAAAEPETPSAQIAATSEPLLAAEALSPDKVDTIRLEKRGEPPVVMTRAASGSDLWMQTEPVTFGLRDSAARDLVNAAAALRHTGTIKPGEGGLTLQKLGLAAEPGPRAVLSFSGEGMEPLTMVLGERAGAGRAYIALGDPRKIETVYVTDDRLHQAALARAMRDLRRTTMASIQPGAAQRVVLQAQDQPPIEAAMQEARWILNEPVKGRADRAAINGLINVLSGAVIEQFVQDQPPDLAVYGLDKPSRVLTVEGVESADADASATVAHKLAIGSPADLERNRYFAMYNDVPVVFTLRKQDVEQLDRKPDQLRDPKLTPVARADVKELTVERKDQPPLHFVRQQGRWMFGEPQPPFSLEPPALDHLLDALLNAQAARYVPLTDDQRPEALATVRMETATRPDAEVLTIYPATASAPGKSEEKTEYVMALRQGENTGYIVPRESLSPLFDPPIAFRERTVLDIAEDQLLELHLTRAGEYPAEYHLVRSASPPDAGGDSDAKLGEWKLDGLDRTKVRRLIESLTPLRAESWLTREVGDQAEFATLRFKLTDGSERTLIIHPTSGEAELNGEPQAFTVSSELARLVGGELRDTAVLSLDISDITTVKHGEVTVKRDAQSRYSLSSVAPGTANAMLDEQKAAAIFDLISSLRAEHFVDAKRAAGEPTATLTVTTAGGDEHMLKLWLPAEGPGVAQLGGHTFTLPRPAAQTLAAPPVK